MTMRRREFLTATAGPSRGDHDLPAAIAQTKRMRSQSDRWCCPIPTIPSRLSTPLFAHLAKELGVDFDLVATTDWAGMAVAMGWAQLDVAWMGPWGYIIANAATNCQAVATVKYDDKPIYLRHHHRPARSWQVSEVSRRHQGQVDLVRRCRLDLGMAGADLYAKEVWKIDPKTYWKYSEGATHAANEIAVSSGQVDMATDFDRNRNTMIAANV